MEVAAWTVLGTPIVVVLVLLLVVAGAFSLVMNTRRQTDLLEALLGEVQQLRAQQTQALVPTTVDTPPEVQLGDAVEVTEGTYAGEQGTVVPPGFSLRPGFVCLEMAGGAKRYVPVSKLARLRDTGEADSDI